MHVENVLHVESQIQISSPWDWIRLVDLIVIILTRMIQWRLMLEEFDPKVLHVAGKENDAADTQSRLDTADNSNDELEWKTPLPPPEERDSNYCSL